MRHLDLFAGIGGFSLAARWMGWETIAQVEWDKWCQEKLAKNFPNALRFGDIVEFNKMLQNEEIFTDTGCLGQEIGKEQTTGIIEYSQEKNVCNTTESRLSKSKKERLSKSILHAERTSLQQRYYIGRIDIITGGFPCQPFSHAGKRKGTSDNRWLWPEMLTTVRILKPAFVVGENVAGLVSMENGKTLDRILSDLENEGYSVESFIIPACAVGAWHRRDRIWIVAHSINGTDRTNGRASRKTESIQGECREAGLSREFSGTNTKIFRAGPDSQTIGLQGCKQTNRNQRQKRNDKQFNGCNREWDESREQWTAEPSVGRVANGIPNRVDRLKGLGNAIVPQVVFEIFKAIEQINQDK